MPYELPALPYDYGALEPHIDEETLRVHHDVIHKSHVDGLNHADEALAASRAESNYTLVKHWEREVAYHGSGHVLHGIYWKNMSPGGGGQPDGELRSAIDETFGSFDAFRAHFTATANAVDGSGWGILGVRRPSGKLVVLQCEKHQNLVAWGVEPILVCDVWEHAYFLKYRARRGEYTRAFFQVVDWKDVATRFVEGRR